MQGMRKHRQLQTHCTAHASTFRSAQVQPRPFPSLSTPILSGAGFDEAISSLDVVSCVSKSVAANRARQASWQYPE